MIKSFNTSLFKNGSDLLVSEKEEMVNEDRLNKPFLNKNFRNLVAYPLAKLLIKMGFVEKALKKAKEGDHLLSVYFHNPAQSEFENTIIWLKKNNFTFLSPSDLENIIDNNLLIPKGSVILTVDDGWQTNEKNIAQIADKHKVPVTIFCSTEAIEEGTYWWSYFKDSANPSIADLKKIPNEQRKAYLEKVKQNINLGREALTLDQLKNLAMSEYVTIGAHTHSHPILTKCGYQEAYQEMKKSKEKLESWLGKEIKYFAYPNGNYGDREIEILKALGFTMAFANDPIYLNQKNILDRMEIPRFGFLEGASFEENMCRIAGIWHSTTRKLKILSDK